MQNDELQADTSAKHKSTIAVDKPGLSPSPFACVSACRPCCVADGDLEMSETISKADYCGIGIFPFQVTTENGQLSERPETEVETGARYKGQWLDKQFHGHGVLKLPDGSVYQGSFAEGNACGFGKMVNANGKVYEGEWRQDVAHGQGTYTHSDGSRYEGAWVSNEKCGHGMEVYADGSVYKGQFMHNKRHGFGVRFSEAGEIVFEGMMEEDKIHGEGTYYHRDKRKYTGQWRDGNMDGNGVFDWPDGSSYRGTMVQNLRQGQGTHTFGNGRVYEGQWLNDQPHGTGVIRTVGNSTETKVRWKAGVLVTDDDKNQQEGTSSTATPADSPNNQAALTARGHEVVEKTKGPQGYGVK